MTFLETYIISITRETCREKNIFGFLLVFQIFMGFIDFIFLYFLFDICYIQGYIKKTITPHFLPEDV